MNNSSKLFHINVDVKDNDILIQHQMTDFTEMSLNKSSEFYIAISGLRRYLQNVMGCTLSQVHLSHHARLWSILLLFSPLSNGPCDHQKHM